MDRVRRGLVYEFVLRKGAKFHNGEPVTAEDVKFSFERYRGVSAKTLKDHVAAVETPDPGRVRFRLKQPWPDFMTYYGDARRRAAGSCRRSTSRRSATTGTRRRPSAPARTGSSRSARGRAGARGVRRYWRKTPAVKRLVLRVVPEQATRRPRSSAARSTSRFSMTSELADEIRRTPGFALKPTYPSEHWLSFPDQWEPKSPWQDRRVRLAANLAIDRAAINEAAHVRSVAG